MEILLAGGIKKPVKELKVGDKVQTLHQDTFKKEEAEVSYVRVIESPLLSLTLSGKEFICSEEDRFYATNLNRWIHASSLLEGDTVSQLDGEVKFEGKKKIGKGKSVELTVDDAHTYVCDGVLMHNKGGSPPPPTIIMPPPPPPPQIVTDVTPQQTYNDAANYMKRMEKREAILDKRRWDAGQTPAATALRRAGTDLRLAENAAALAGPPPPSSQPGFYGSLTMPGVKGSSSVIDALFAGPSQGSQSRDARIRPSSGDFDASLPYIPPSGPEARLAAAQQAYDLASTRKANEVYVQPEFEAPSWADRDWYDEIKKWSDRSDKVEMGDPTPVVYDAEDLKKKKTT
tara:strand:+ start:2518 stop:3549 length:1032 start_codon:yes stop_codon:yes gene_type:complete